MCSKPTTGIPVRTGPRRPRQRAISARLELPGSKSITNRALVLAALAHGPTRIGRPLRARDTDLMAGAIGALGATVSAEGDPRDDDWLVTPGWRDSATTVDVGNAGHRDQVRRRPRPRWPGLTWHSGATPRAAQRPVGPLLTALEELGARIDDDGRRAVPFTVRGQGRMPGGTVTLDASGSSQLVSGLLLAAPRYDKGAEIRHAGPRVPSAPHIAMTVRHAAGGGR